MSDAMHRRDHGGVAWHDDPEDEGRDQHGADRWPAPPDATRPDDGLRAVRHSDPDAGRPWRPGPDLEATRRVDDDGGWTAPPAEDRRWGEPQRRGPDVAQPPWEVPQGDDLHRRLDQLPPPVARDDRRPPPGTAASARPVDGPQPDGGDVVARGPLGADPLRRGADDVGQPAGARAAASPADPDGDHAAPPEDADGHAPPPHHEIEESVPASVRLRAAGAQVAARVRRSVPLRTALFVLPPLLLPPALGLPLGASLVATLLLLWLAGAAALLATIMFDGSDQLALRSIDRRLQALEASVGAAVPTAGTAAAAAAPAAPATRPSGDTDDALLAIGGQLDRLNDRLDQLAAPRPDRPRPDVHRPAEQWSGQPEVGEDVGDAPYRGSRQWSDEGWQGRMR